MNIHEKIVEIRKIIPYFKKDTKGYQYSYVSGTSVLSAIQDKMNDLKVLLVPSIASQSVVFVDIENSKGETYKDAVVACDMKMTWIDAENPEDRLEVPWACFGQQTDVSKAFGSALTYTERYFLLKFFNVPTDSDDPDAFQKKKEASQPFKEKILKDLPACKDDNEVEAFILADYTNYNQQPKDSIEIGKALEHPTYPDRIRRIADSTENGYLKVILTRALELNDAKFEKMDNDSFNEILQGLESCSTESDLKKYSKEVAPVIKDFHDNALRDSLRNNFKTRLKELKEDRDNHKEKLSEIANEDLR